MQRRQFLQSSAALALASLGSRLRAAEGPADVKITRIVGFQMTSPRPKYVGKNSFKGDHGDTATDVLARIYTSSGVEGVGQSRAPESAFAALLGRNPLDLFHRDAKQTDAGLANGTAPLWDLCGRLLEQPVWKLLGAQGPERVRVYDGSIYFIDLLPQYESSWRDRVREEIDMGLARGHRMFKVKLGRGNKWMDRRAGDDRDVEIVKIISAHGGKDVKIGIDANNGYDLAGTKRLFERLEGIQIEFAEEMFPETVEECLEFKEFLARHTKGTKLADGESASGPEHFEPYVEAKAMDVLQGDMNRFGIEGILAEAALARPHQILVAPHNWGSVMGFYGQLQVGRGIDNFYAAEQDPAVSQVIVADGYRITNGTVQVPDRPGFGLQINEDAFRDVKVLFDLKHS